MEVRGLRRCTECDHRWSYFETGSAACPSCGSLRSVSVDDEAALHTDVPVALDLAPVRSMLDDRPLPEVADAARSTAREYVRSRGFVAAGELLDLDGTVFAAAELGHAGDHLRRSLSVDEPTEAYFLALLAGAEAGDRPDSIPVDLRWARGLAASDVVGAYRRDLGKWLGEAPRPAVRPVIDLLRSHERRIDALDGAVPPADAEALVSAASDIGSYLREGDEAALERAEERLSRLG